MKYKERIISEWEFNHPSISTAMSLAEQVRRLRECRIDDAANDGTSTSTPAVTEPVEIQRSNEAPGSTEDDCEDVVFNRMDVELNRIDVMQDNWSAANEHFEAVFVNPFGLTCGCGLRRI